MRTNRLPWCPFARYPRPNHLSPNLTGSQTGLSARGWDCFGLFFCVTYSYLFCQTIALLISSRSSSLCLVVTYGRCKSPVFTSGAETGEEQPGRR
ncbi:hypothetical protein NDU88_003474 [Pleurodeles waltl]|uniref:Uncharacterized protein n=1 Tax=Pleurodeles waltl TaxID=8319 RepID=A0AAV7L640_PLEWA|nr:hypothetical protein NDU88_003474 [Pleurodeles waltl]